MLPAASAAAAAVTSLQMPSSNYQNFLPLWILLPLKALFTESLDTESSYWLKIKFANGIISSESPNRITEPVQFDWFILTQFWLIHFDWFILRLIHFLPDPLNHLNWIISTNLRNHAPTESSPIKTKIKNKNHFLFLFLSCFFIFIIFINQTQH